MSDERNRVILQVCKMTYAEIADTILALRAELARCRQLLECRDEEIVGLEAELERARDAWTT